MKESELNNLEEFIPELAKGAVKKAYLDALLAGAMDKHNYYSYGSPLSAEKTQLV